MIRHITLMLAVIAFAAAAGIALVPGDRERWTMMLRDNRNDEALQLLEKRYDAGGRDTATVLQLYKLLMLDADISRATDVVEQLAARNPNSIETLTLLAKHYWDTQNRQAQVDTLERLYALDASPKTSQTLLSIYRLAGTFDKEEKLLHKLFTQRIITTDDAERLGLLRYARQDLSGAREVLAYFDTIAPPNRMEGRYALFNLLIQTGETQMALSKASDWLQKLRKSDVRPDQDADTPDFQLAEWMKYAASVAAGGSSCSTAQADLQDVASHQMRDLRCFDTASDTQTNPLATNVALSMAEQPKVNITGVQFKRTMGQRRKPTQVALTYVKRRK